MTQILIFFKGNTFNYRGGRWCYILHFSFCRYQFTHNSKSWQKKVPAQSLLSWSISHKVKLKLHTHFQPNPSRRHTDFGEVQDQSHWGTRNMLLWGLKCLAQGQNRRQRHIGFDTSSLPDRKELPYANRAKLDCRTQDLIWQPSGCWLVFLTTRLPAASRLLTHFDPEDRLNITPLLSKHALMGRLSQQCHCNMGHTTPEPNNRHILEEKLSDWFTVLFFIERYACDVTSEVNGSDKHSISEWINNQPTITAKMGIH